MKTLSITFFTQLRMLSFLVFITIIWAVLLIWLLDGHTDPFDVIYFLLPIYIIVYLLPTCYVHYIYYKANNGTIFTLDKKEIKFTWKNKMINYNVDEIVKINFYGNKRNSYKRLSFQDYYYALIYFNDEKYIIVTSLLHHNIDEIFHETYITVPCQWKDEGLLSGMIPVDLQIDASKVKF